MEEGEATREEVVRGEALEEGEANWVEVEAIQVAEANGVEVEATQVEEDTGATPAEKDNNETMQTFQKPRMLMKNVIDTDH